jgi:hypothetical protein
LDIPRLLLVSHNIANKHNLAIFLNLDSQDDLHQDIFFLFLMTLLKTIKLFHTTLNWHKYIQYLLDKRHNLNFIDLKILEILTEIFNKIKSLQNIFTVYSRLIRLNLINLLFFIE